MIYRNVPDDTTDFEVSRFIKNKILPSRQQNIFSSNKKVHSLYINGYNMEKKKKKSDGELVIFVMLSGFCVLMGWGFLVGLLKENSIQNSFLKIFRKCVSEFSYTLAELFNMG